MNEGGTPSNSLWAHRDSEVKQQCNPAAEFSFEGMEASSGRGWVVFKDGMETHLNMFEPFEFHGEQRRCMRTKNAKLRFQLVCEP